MLDENFVYVAVLIIAVGDLSYLVGTVKGRVHPNRVTWFLWGLAPIIAFAAEFGEGVGTQALMTLMVGLGPAAIFLASFVNRQAYWRLGRLDVMCGVLSLLGLVLWLVTQSGNLAIMLTIAADALAAVPTVIKAYRHPRTESPWAFVAAGAGAAIALLTIDQWDFAHVGFPAYILVITGLLAVLLMFRIGERVAVRGAAEPVMVPVARHGDADA